MSDDLDEILARVASGSLTPEEAEPLVAASVAAHGAEADHGDPGHAGAASGTRAWTRGPDTTDTVGTMEAPHAPTPPAAHPSAVRQTAGIAATRAIRIQVTDGGRSVVNLRVPMSLASLAGSVIPGLADAQVARLRQALRDGEVGTIVDVRDASGSGVLISTE